MHQAKQWSSWIELPFNQDGVLDTRLLSGVPNRLRGLCYCQ